MSVLARLRKAPAAAYAFLAFSTLGALAELAFHFVPPAAIPAVAGWVAGLSPVDRDFFGMAFELTAHIGIAVGLMGMVATLLYHQLRKTES
jgi:hypothetical protein